MSKISQSIARPARTAGQGGLAYAIVEVIDAFGAGFTGRQYGALLLLLTIVVGALQVVVENRLGRALLRYIPPTDAPLVDSVPSGEPEQTDNRPREEDGPQLPSDVNGDDREWTGEDMR